MTRIVIIGGGPAGYEAALVASQHGGTVTLIDSDGVGGACVLWDCVPSKTFIASTGIRTDMRRASDLGIELDPTSATIDLPQIHNRVKSLAQAQSSDIRARLQTVGVTVLSGTAKVVDTQPGLAAHQVEATLADGSTQEIDAEVVLIATGASPRILPGAEPDGERILTWRQLYDLDSLPTHLIVVGSGVTGAEFVSAYTEMGVKVTVVSSRDRVLPGEDADAALVLEDVLSERGVTLIKNARADSVTRTADGIVVTMSDGKTVEGSHALMTVGSVPNTQNLGLESVGIELDRGGYLRVDRVSRTRVPGIYAAGDCTGLLPLASVAAMQGRIAMYHALGEGVSPIKLKTVASAVFTRPEIATVGVGQSAIDNGDVPARTVMLPLNTNPRAKMSGLRRGFVKIFCRPATGVVIGGVVVAPTASELILPIAIAVQNNLTVNDLAATFSVYPSLTGSITEAARQLMRHDDLD
ncbi:NAD(P)H-quinone dehydrogenase [Rhodococcus sp. BP-149]|jgi:dihydrolipoamide dehydrogenase|uniref:NAD(P)H-quinone dehydrogenase n=1 Tax=unclassified Rhodococcus (in: high G+C Gram-positive bacteria) TaxID=192944 RepID=UPI0004846D74|nr:MULTISPECIES: NAD(P)H-quinone dehydrogenase [unclassified Rhodococcus (in: high G+C Gram-positive bacteria)]MBY6678054.1 NAD(P)H-quinone dehydrogenase [Rhodococcus sp. BP-332]MBY6681776.1 NAD(P)H-quinone dehydrogenase [Rhodococcus sp. BP-316]MBY6683916.1 NAD(P)H-quinone dehydrogenase [Rhodococcus sp. BP-288]MBY6693423.1 NAD(P)H-quinone dehydrogenase [Rhodococcus sp. BP-188]MBY6697620.1 NAD(P)H-quinone dehydrogenase [Rhodococcus sp. BP-285]